MTAHGRGNDAVLHDGSSNFQRAEEIKKFFLQDVFLRDEFFAASIYEASGAFGEKQISTASEIDALEFV
jgi:hypothetical protein